MKPLLIVALYTLANVAMGYGVLRLVGRSGAVSLQRIYPISVQFALGSSLLSVVWLLLALAGQLRSGVVWTVALCTMAIAVPGMARGSARMLLAASQSALTAIRANPGFSLLILMASAVTAWFGVLAWTRPPFGDADAFYMAYPKIIAATGRLTPMAGGYRDFSAIGLSGELHFAALMAISNTAVAKLFAWVAGVGLLLLLKDLTRLVGGGMVAQGISVVMLLTSTTFSDYLSDGKTDLFAALSGLAAVVCLLHARESAAIASIVIAGILTGFSLTAKFSYVVALLPAILLLNVLLNHGEGSSATLGAHFVRASKVTVVICLGALIGSLPHLLKNQLLFGHALAPFFGMQGNWADMSTWYSSADTLWIVATYPFALVFGLYPLMGGNMSFLWLAAIPLAMFMPRRTWLVSGPLMQLTLSACAGMLCWLALKASVLAPRYILATLVMLIPLPALAAEYVWHHEARPRLVSLGFAAMAGIALAAAPFIPPAGVWTALPDPIIQHLMSGRPECGLAITSYCDSFRKLSAKAKEGERVFVAGYYTYWLRPDLLQCINEHNDLKLLSQTSSSEIWSALYGNDFSHIAIQKATHGQYLKILDPAGAPPWLKVTAESADSDMPVFHLESLDAKRRPAIVCSRTGRNSWAPLTVSGEAR